MVMPMRWIKCPAVPAGGNIHLIGPCPNCSDSKGGLLIGTVSGSFKGRITAECLECGTVVDFYIEAEEGNVWRLEPVEAKGPLAPRASSERF